MIEHGFTPEHVQYIADATLGLYALGMAFTTRQREWIRRRDDNVCQACALGIVHPNCNGGPNIPVAERRLEIHHVIPQRYAKAIGMDTADFPENAITLSNSFHQGVIHPDMRQALHDYRRGDKGSFKRVGVNRDAMLNERTIYWNSIYDRILQTRAIQMTQRFRRNRENGEFPEKP